MEQTQKMPFEEAQKEVMDWLDNKNYQQSKREANKEQIEALTNAIVDGVISINEDGTIEHQLLIPLVDEKTGDEVYSELKYRARCNYKMVKPYMKNIKGDDTMGMINAYIAALIQKGMGIVEALDSSDLSIARSIATFFL